MSDAIKGFLLAAGFGKRMRPLTERLAKPALPLFDKPLAAYSLDNMKKAGVEDVVVNLHHLGDTVKDSLAPYLASFKSHNWSFEEEILGTGGALLPWLDHLGSCPFFLVNGDTYRDTDLGKLADFHRERGAIATLALSPSTNEKPPIEIDRSGRIVTFLGVRAPGTDGGMGCDFIGVHLFEPDVAGRVGAVEEISFCINQKVNRRMVKDGLPVYGYLLEEGGWWGDLGTPKRYLDAHRHFLGKGKIPSSAGGTFFGSGDFIFGKGAVRGPSWLGEGAALEEGSTVGPYGVVGAKTLVKAGACLDNAVALPSSIVSGSAHNEIVFEELKVSAKES